MNSEKQYKYIEDKIKVAAEGADYAFDEALWKKMEAQLDKDKDRRRPFFWIFGTLLLGALLLGGGIIYQSAHKNTTAQNTGTEIKYKANQQHQQPVSDNGGIITAQQTRLPQDDDAKAKTNSGSGISKSGNTDSTTNYDTDNSFSAQKDKSYSIADFSPAIKLKLKNIRSKNNTPGYDDTAVNDTAINKNRYTGKNKFAVKITAPGLENDISSNESKTTAAADVAVTDIKKGKTYLQKNDMAVKISAPGLETDISTNENKTEIDAGDAVTDKKDTKTDVTKNDITKVQEDNKTDTAVKKVNSITKADNKKDKKGKTIAGFYLLGAIGAEASSTKILSYKNSAISPSYGAGIGYRFNKRLSVQTGFYAGAKKYVAGPNDYNVKPGSYLSTVKILKVDADCMIYEVPVTLQYNWLIKPKTNYYASVGISNYIMKKEKYNYTFEIYNTQYTYPYDYTKNSHLLASLQFSLGMEKQILPRLFLQAAPIINLPLQGVGEGSVKIFTTRLQVGLKYFPFKH